MLDISICSSSQLGLGRRDDSIGTRRFLLDPRLGCASTTSTNATFFFCSTWPQARNRQMLAMIIAPVHRAARTIRLSSSSAARSTDTANVKK